MRGLSTFSRLVQRTRHRLSGFDGIMDASTELSDDITADATDVPVTDVQGFGRGVVEIDLEVVRIASTDETSEVLHAPTFGRGYRGTIPTVHSAGAEVTFNPIFPASDVASVEAIRTTSRSISTTPRPKPWTSVTGMSTTSAVMSLLSSVEASMMASKPERRWRVRCTSLLNVDNRFTPC